MLRKVEKKVTDPRKGKITTLPLPSICPAAPSCLSNANLFPFVKWAGFSFPDKFEQEKVTKKRDSRKKLSNHSRSCAHMQDVDTDYTITIIVVA